MGDETNNAPSCPEPGVYEDVPFEEYVRWDAVSNSRLGKLATSPKHYLLPFGETTESMLFGTLTHGGVLEGESLSKRYAVLRDWHLDEGNVTATGKRSDSKATRYYKERLQDFTAAHEGKEFVTLDQFRRMKSILDAVLGDRAAADLFTEPGAAELSMVWDDPETGIRCKGRIDKLGEGRFGDLKTIADISAASRHVAKFGYHRQQAFYQTGWAVLNGGELLQPWLSFVESNAPHCVLTAPVSELALAAGRFEFAALLRKLQDCHVSGCWPGPSPPQEWCLPDWAMPSGMPRYVETETEIVAV